MKKQRIAALLLTCFLLLTACSSSPKKDGLSVVTTNFALYDFARAVCGENGTVTMLLKPGSESHDFEATLADVAAIAEADLFFCVGGESEEWVGDVLESISSAGSKLPETLCAMELVETYEEELVEGMEAEEEEAPDEAEEPELDEHVWTSFENAGLLIDAFADRMQKLDSGHADDYRTHADAYLARLKELRAQYADVIGHAARKTIVLADRFPFRYLTEEWELDYYAAFAGCSSATEPSLTTVRFLIEKVEAESIPAVFIIEFSDGRTADAVARETGCAVLTLHSAHNVSAEDFAAGVTYADLMERNLEALRTALN